ncbi:hypothetical protein BD309DRAFT_993264 [Dichomitus squalens]|nr:hypothetical protein BD309DRAFT_993264 [Dichomitus squalens]
MRIPQEIHDEIIGFLHDDRDALQTCALVCRAWLLRVRFHLFRTVTLDPSPRSCSFVKLAQLCPEIQPYVRDLELRGRAPSSKAWWEAAQPTDIRWPTLPGGVPHPAALRREPDAVEVLSWLRLTFAPPDCGGGPPLLTLSKIYTLRLSETTLNAESAAFLAEVFPHVRTLSVNQCRVMSFAGLARLFQAFPRLSTLRLLAVEWLPHRTGGVLPDTTPGSLASLTAVDFSRDIYLEPLIEWFLKVSAHKSIRSLTCSIATRKSATAIRTFLKASGTSLHELSITLAEAQDPTAILEATQLDLSTSMGLRSLHIPCLHSRMGFPSRSLSWVLILLAKVRSPNLEEIRISITSPELARLNLEGLDVVLAQNALSRMRSLTFDVDDTKVASKRGPAEVERLLTQRVPTASAQRLVRVEYRC